MTLDQNSVMHKLEGGGVEKPKSQKLIFLCQSIVNSNLYNIFKNQSVWSIRRGDMKGVSSFLTLKKAVLSYLSTKLR